MSIATNGASRPTLTPPTGAPGQGPGAGAPTWSSRTFAPAYLERRNLGTHDSSQLPQLVWCTISGFGPTSDRVGYDFIVQAEQGWMAITGEPAGEPMKIGVALADVIAGKDAAAAILGAFSHAAGARLPPTIAASPSRWRTARRLRSSMSLKMCS